MAYHKRLKLAHYLLSESKQKPVEVGLEQRIAQKHIATYLGITPAFLSMLRKSKKL